MKSTAAVLTGLGGFLPGPPIGNSEIAERLGVSPEWIVQRTGIHARHYSPPGMTTSDLAYEAGMRALGGEDAASIDLLVLATTTPDHLCPATAPAVAARLGSGTVPAFDISAVCAGFVYGMAVATALVESGMAERAMVIGAEIYSTILDPHDRSTAAIFGDGAGAVVLRAGQPEEPGAVQAIDLGSDGSHADLIMIPGGGARARSSRAEAQWSPYFTMQGRHVFAEAVRRMVESSAAVTKKAGWDGDDVTKLVAHQANVRILRAVADELGMPRERAAVHLDRVGNTSAASIPLALDHIRGELRAGDRIVLTAFGGGTAWGSVALTWPEL
ncbi:beta-ketoacyl-ACP synthase III [Nocardia transvalensis]|uniref:beta-ketoacyl-ACP synthase III n=1 Tax=Nocardia transvalensis TaxID=37333 RepID=UPI001895905F|nr:beta-ketoacyl-ACP synthase III [Nocardia transvalensis]MBF6331953.1 ketoacyl-ACP synthase III [Nocardia transvalensis]